MARVNNLTCTPHGLIAEYPCMKCASTSELLAVIGLILYALTHEGDTTLTDMLEEGKCFKCLSDHDMLVASANALLAIAVAYDYFTDAAEALQTAKCLTCSDPAIVKGLIVGTLCEYINDQWPVEN